MRIKRTEDETEFGKAKFYLASCANLVASLLPQYHITIMWANEIIASRNVFFVYPELQTSRVDILVHLKKCLTAKSW